MQEPLIPINHEALRRYTIKQLNFAIYTLNTHIHYPENNPDIKLINVVMIWLKWRLNQLKIHKLIGK